MKIAKVIKTFYEPNEKGLYCVVCQAHFGNTYRYINLCFDTVEEAKAVKAGDFIDIEKTKVTYNTTTPVKP